MDTFLTLDAYRKNNPPDIPNRIWLALPHGLHERAANITV